MWFKFNFSRVLWFLYMFQLFGSSVGLFFPMFGNFFSRFKGNQNGNHFGGGGGIGREGGGGGVSVFSAANGANTGTGNFTSYSVPMLNSGLHRRVDVVTTVVSNPIDQPASAASSLSPQLVRAPANISSTGDASSNSTASSDQQNTSVNQKITFPTSTRVTSSISAVQQGIPVTITLNQRLGEQNYKTPNTLTLPFTPNLFGMMSYVQALKDIKRNYHDQEKERKIVFHNKDGGDLMTRVLRTLIQKVVNKYQKQTEILKLKIIKRQDKLQKFLQLPMVAQVIAMDRARQVNRGEVAVPQSVPLGKVGSNVVVQTSAHIGALSPSGKPAHSIINSFLI